THNGSTTCRRNNPLNPSSNSDPSTASFHASTSGKSNTPDLFVSLIVVFISPPILSGRVGHLRGDPPNSLKNLFTKNPRKTASFTPFFPSWKGELPRAPYFQVHTSKSQIQNSHEISNMKFEIPPGRVR